MCTPQAFVALLSALGTTLPALLANTALLVNVLRYHVVTHSILTNTTALAAAGRQPTLLSGKSLMFAGT